MYRLSAVFRFGAKELFAIDNLVCLVNLSRPSLKWLVGPDLDILLTQTEDIVDVYIDDVVTTCSEAGTMSYATVK